jgi:hypothetical protein
MEQSCFATNWSPLDAHTRLHTLYKKQRGERIHRWTLERKIGKQRERNIPGNSITLVSEARTFSDIMAVIRDSKSEGAIVTTRIPCRARSRVRGRVSERIAPLEAA